MSNKNDENFTGIKNGVVYQNGKPICETFTRNTDGKNSIDPKEVIKRKKDNTK